jgi:hypothetical protein
MVITNAIRHSAFTRRCTPLGWRFLGVLDGGFIVIERPWFTPPVRSVAAEQEGRF